MNETVPTTAQPPLSQIERVADVFFAPTKTFTDILRSTSWWLPFFLLVLVTISVTYTVDRQVGFDRVVENVINASPKQQEQMANDTPESRALKLSQMAKGYRYTSYGSPVLILVIASLGSLVLLGTFNFGLGASMTFGQMLCIWLYAALPRMISGLLTIVTLCFGGNAESFDLKNQVGTNLAYYLSDAPAWLKSALGFFDIIGIWNLILLIVGTSIVAKVSRGRAAAVVVGWWLLVMFISVAVTAATS